MSTSFSIDDYEAVGGRRLGAADGAAIAATAGSRTFAWGAPFFMGRRIVLVFDGGGVPKIPGAVGPFFAIP